MRITAEDLVKEFEGCKLTAYRDIGGVLTVGYGHVGKDVSEGLVWTQEQADEALAHDLLAAHLYDYRGQYEQSGHGDIQQYRGCHPYRQLLRSDPRLRRGADLHLLT